MGAQEADQGAKRRSDQPLSWWELGLLCSLPGRQLQRRDVALEVWVKRWGRAATDPGGQCAP